MNRRQKDRLKEVERGLDDHDEAFSYAAEIAGNHEARIEALEAALREGNRAQRAIENPDLPLTTRLHVAQALEVPVFGFYVKLNATTPQKRVLSVATVEGGLITAWDHDREDWRRFRADRFTALYVASGERFVRGPEDFS